MKQIRTVIKIGRYSDKFGNTYNIIQKYVVKKAPGTTGGEYMGRVGEEIECYGYGDPRYFEPVVKLANKKNVLIVESYFGTKRAALDYVRGFNLTIVDYSPKKQIKDEAH